MRNKKNIIQLFQGALAVGGVVFINHPDILMACNAAIIASVTTSLLDKNDVKGFIGNGVVQFRDSLNSAIKEDSLKSSAESKIYAASMDVSHISGNSDFKYEFGEIVLRYVQQRLKDNKRVRSSCRTTGNIFHFYIISDDQIEAKDFLKHLHSQIMTGLPKLPNTLSTKIGIGFSNLNWSPDNSTCSTMFSRIISDADIARLVGKNNGTCVQEYEDGFSDNVKDKIELEYDLSNCIKNKEIVLLYQPKVSTITGEIESLEALSRWHHHTRGLISPVFFIPLAEETGAINEIGAFTIEEAIKDLSEIIMTTKKEVSLAINISIKQFEMNDGLDLKRQIFDACAVYNIPHRLIQLEVTETAAARDINSIIKQLEFFRSEGFGISLDDFGVGYSSLLRLSSMPLTQVKIDRAFIIDESKSGVELLTSIVNISKSMDVEIVAEGVETEEQAEVITKLGCDHIQGFLYSKPTTKSNIIEMINSKKRLGDRQ